MSELSVQSNRCFVCDASVFNASSESSQTTRFSRTSVFELLEQFVGHQLPRTETDIWCADCIDKIDNYDQAISTAKEVQSELLLLFSTTVNNYNELEADCKSKNHSATDMILLDETCNAEDLADLSEHTGNIAEEDALESSDHSNADPAGDHVSVDDEDDNNAMNNDDSGDDYEDDDEDEDYTLPVLKAEKIPKKRGRPRKTNAVTRHNYKKKETTHSRTAQQRRYKTGPPFQCDICNLKVEVRSEYKAHVKSHHTNSASHLICDVCGQTYKSKTALAIHVDMHKGVSPHECGMCGKQFTQRGALTRHMPLHTGERPYQCDKCGKQFIHYSSFHMHQLAHDNIREKKCEICGMELRSNSHLTRHMRVHSGEKPYSCPTCGQKFAQRYNMMTHYKAHQGIHRVNTKTFPCPICQVVLTKQSKLNDHLSVHHAWTPLKPENAEKLEIVLTEAAVTSLAASTTNDHISSANAMRTAAAKFPITVDPRSVDIKKENPYVEVFE